MSTISTLYFVDDDPDDHVIFRDLVSKEFPEICVVFFFSARELFTQLNKLEMLPSAIILDYNMPVMNGLECLQELKRSKYFAEVPVIIYSTSGYPAAKDLAKKAGAWKYEVKGDSPETRRMIESILCLEPVRP